MKQTTVPQRPVITEEEAIEREFSPELLPRSSIPYDSSVQIVNQTDDIAQLQKEREMVKHRELEALSCKLMEKKHISTGSHHSNRVFENDVE